MGMVVGGVVDVDREGCRRQPRAVHLPGVVVILCARCFALGLTFTFFAATAAACAAITWFAA